MTGEFSQFNEAVLLVHDQLMVEKPYEGEVRTTYFNCVDEKSSVFSLVAGAARVQVNLLVYSVLHGWIRTLRIINYLLALPKRLKHRSHLIPDKSFIICKVGEKLWKPTENEKEAENALFKYETKVIKDCLKIEQIQEYEEIEGVLFYQGRNQYNPET